jgi:hypothetical protein
MLNFPKSLVKTLKEIPLQKFFQRENILVFDISVRDPFHNRLVPSLQSMEHVEQFTEKDFQHIHSAEFWFWYAFRWPSFNVVWVRIVRLLIFLACSVNMHKVWSHFRSLFGFFLCHTNARDWRFPAVWVGNGGPIDMMWFFQMGNYLVKFEDVALRIVTM